LNISQMLLGWSIQRGWIGRGCSTHVGDEKCVLYFGSWTWKEETTRKI